MDITRLIELCREGDANAFGELYKAYVQKMRGVCRRYVKNEQFVDDVLHDAFIIIFTSFYKLRDASKAESWMMSITRNVASKYIDHLKSLSSVSLDEAELSVAPYEENSIKGVPIEDVLKLIDKLPEGYGQVFRLSVFEGMSHKEIAAILGIEPHSSSSQLARAKKMLRKMIQQYWTVLILLLIPLALFLQSKEESIVKEEKTIAEKQKEKQKDLSTVQFHKPVIVHSIEPINPDSSTKLIAQGQAFPDTAEAKEIPDTAYITEKPELQHYDIANIFSEKTVKRIYNKQKWSIELAYAGSMGEQNASHPYSFTETPTLAITGEPPSPVTFKNWSDYAAFLADNPDDGSSHSRSVIMNIALNNAGDATGTDTDEIIRRSHHYMPINFSFALKYNLSNRLALESGLSYSRLRSEFEIGSNGNTINEQQTIHYLGIPIKGTYKIYNNNMWGLYGRLGLTMEIPVYSPLTINYFLHGTLEGREKNTIRAPWQWSIGTGIGLQYHLTPNIGLFAEPSLQYYIPTGSQIETYHTEHPFTFSLPLGIRFTW